MASNYDMNIETTTESYGALKHVKHCVKNPQHTGFYSVKELNADIMPNECRTEQWVSYINNWCKRVVRLTVNKANGGSLYGSGYVIKYLNSNTLCIRTNEHVVGSQEDVDNCTIDFFYDTEDRIGMEISYGVEFERCDQQMDLCRFTFKPIPHGISQLMSTESLFQPPTTDLRDMIAISHPHGGPKTITMGQYLGSKPDESGFYAHSHTARTCPGSSGGLVIGTWSSRSFSDWRYNTHFTHFAGQRCDSYYIGMRHLKSETNNVNESVFW